MTWALFVHDRVEKFVLKQDKAIKSLLMPKLLQLKDNPFLGEKLVSSRFRKARAGDYRIIYEIFFDEKEVHVVFIGHRKEVYDDLARIL